jgi:hypothetical protein|tara:strand:+ start:1283 stop:1396 length:114 start_codon:yes stop_codon:yes gene_type:complete
MTHFGLFSRFALHEGVAPALNLAVQRAVRTNSIHVQD